MSPHDALAVSETVTHESILYTTPSVPEYTRFDISRFMPFAMHLDLHYALYTRMEGLHSKNNVSRKAKISYIYYGIKGVPR